MKFVRVILSARVEQFNKGIRGAAKTFNGFVRSVERGVGNAVKSLIGMARGLFFLREGLQTLSNIAQGLFETFIGGAIDIERFGVALEVVTDDAQQAQEMIAFLREESTRTGQDFAGLAQSGQQLAVALRGAQGSVDTEVWEELVHQVEAFQALRPDVPVSLWGRAISAFLAGDPSTLTRLLDVNVRQLGTLSEEAKAVLAGAGAASEQQLGQVTRLTGGVAASGTDMLSVLGEVAQAVGATDELVDRIAETTGGKLEQSQAELKDTLSEIGLKVLPQLNEALGELLEFMRSEDFENFADAFGDFAVEGIEKLFELLQQIDPAVVKSVFGSMADALNSVDWEAVARVLDSIVKFLTTPIESPVLKALNMFGEGNPLLEQRTPNAGTQGAQRASEAAAAEGKGPIGQFAAGVGGFIGANAGTPQVEVIVSVDEEGQLNVKNVAAKEADLSLNDVLGLLK